MDNYFNELNTLNFGKLTEKKNNLTYLSWSYAWEAVKQMDPSATFTIYENANGWMYHTDGRTAWVKVGVTVFGIEHIEYLAIMDYRNNSIPLEKITSTDAVNTMQRAITKACARHGVALYLYNHDGIPKEAPKKKQEEPRKTKADFVPNVYGDGPTFDDDEIPF